MTDTQFLYAIFGSWIVLLLVMVWVLFLQRKGRPGSFKSAMLIVGILTAISVYGRTSSVWATLGIVLCAIAGAVMGEIANRQWDKAHRL